MAVAVHRQRALLPHAAEEQVEPLLLEHHAQVLK
jgi:hypothetical protein